VFMSFCQKVKSRILGSFHNLGCHDLASVLIYNFAMCMATKVTWSDGLTMAVLLFSLMVTIIHERHSGG
jgi:hypothetical protein